jgi:hypothetical protein
MCGLQRSMRTDVYEEYESNAKMNDDGGKGVGDVIGGFGMT